VRREGDGITVGVTDFAQHQLSDLVYIELPTPGAMIEQGAVLVTLESVKAVGEVYAPVSGAITTVNTALEEHPELVNTDPYGQGWLVRLTPRDPEAINALMDSDAYARQTEPST
jgi:glycine cleavage system H protein